MNVFTGFSELDYQVYPTFLWLVYQVHKENMNVSEVKNNLGNPFYERH